MYRGMPLLQEMLKKNIQVGQMDLNKKIDPTFTVPKEIVHSPVRRQEGVEL